MLPGAVTKVFTGMTSLNLCYHSELGTLLSPIWHVRNWSPKPHRRSKSELALEPRLWVTVSSASQRSGDVTSETGQSSLRTSSSWMWRKKRNLKLRLDSWTQQKFQLATTVLDGKHHCSGLDGSSYEFRFCVFNIKETLNLVETENAWKMTSLTQGWSWNAWLGFWPHPPVPPEVLPAAVATWPQAKAAVE